MTLANIGKNLGHFLSRNSPAILMGMSLAGVLTTAYLAHKAGQKSLRQIEEAEGNDTALSAKEKVQLTWMNYIPPVLSCGATVAFIIAGNTVHARRQAALITAVSLGETALSEYKEKMVEVLGKNKERKASDEIVQKQVNKAEEEGKFTRLAVPNDERQEIYVFDTFSGRPFVSTIEKIHKAANEVARECINNDYATLNLFYAKIGLTEIPIGDEMGWNNDHPIEIDTTSARVDPTNESRALIAINYLNKPQIGFDKIWR